MVIAYCRGCNETHFGTVQKRSVTSGSGPYYKSVGITHGLRTDILPGNIRDITVWLKNPFYKRNMGVTDYFHASE